MSEALIAFPDPAQRSRVRSLLEGAGIQVVDAMNGLFALQVLRNRRVNLVLLQERLGDLPVEEVIEGTRSVSLEEPILVFLETSSVARALELMQRGVYDCVEPHWRPAVLLGILRKAMGRTEPVPVFAAPAAFWRRPANWALFLLALAFLGGAASYARWLEGRREEARAAQDLRSEREYPLPYTHPAGIASDGESVWICDWFTQAIYQHARDDAFSIRRVHHFADINPVAMTWAGSVLWVVSATGKIQKHALDDKLTLLASAASPGPQPSGIAFDGNYLWSSDLQTKTVYRHLPDARLTVTAQYPYPGDSPVALFWDGKNLWSVDGLRKTLLRHRVEGERLLVDGIKQYARYRDPECKLLAAAYDGGRFWSLTENPPRAVRHPLGEEP